MVGDSLVGCAGGFVRTLDYKILKRIARLPLTWLTCAFWIILFTIGAYYGVQMLHGGETELRVVSVMDGIENHNWAWSTHYCGLFAPYSDDYQLEDLDKTQWWSGLAPTQESIMAYNRTLGMLMTTPINSFQIVMGKLFSKLFQLILLLSISLPLLAIVRVFGGVPWAYVVSSLCITLSTVIFVGSLSLFFFIFSRRAYVVIIMTTLTLTVLFMLMPFLLIMTWHNMDLQTIIPEKTLFAVIFQPNPYVNMFFNTMRMMEPRAATVMPFTISWSLHSGIMLLTSVIILSLSVIIVRKVALFQAVGQLDVSFRRRRSYKNAFHGSVNEQELTTAPRQVTGPAVIWKELISPMFRRHKIATIIVAIIGLILLLITYALLAHEDMLNDEETHMLYATVFLGLGILFTIVLSATSITSEKESRSWPLLLATTLDDRQILFGKFVGVLRRCLPIWSLLFGHVFIFSLLGLIHPIAIIQIGILVTWIVVFLSCSGLYFSSRFKRTTTAVIIKFILAAVIWAIFPLLMAIVTGIIGDGHNFVEAYMDTNPFVHSIVIMDATAKGSSISRYDWIVVRRVNVVDSTIWMLVCMTGYVLLGLVFAWRAQRRFRRNIF